MVEKTLFFYDLETSGLSPSNDRIMQFAGQRTDMQLNPIEKPYNVLIKLTPDILPSPWAIMVTGITPQMTVREGLTEERFLKLFHKHIAVPGTVFVGFNNVRFDDEFLRYLNYRNFCDPYEWHWADGRGRWDLLDAVRMTRALRPDGIVWPFDSGGKPANRLEYLTKVNKLSHAKAHDAQDDVIASIALARLLRSKQPKLFDYLLGMRDKRKVEQLVSGSEPFIYTSGKYDFETEKTTIAVEFAKHPNRGASLVFDLRFNPEDYKDYTAKQLVEAWRWRPEKTEPSLPVKTLSYNRCPAIAPLSVLDKASEERLGLNLELAKKHQAKLAKMPEFAKRVLEAVEIMDKDRQTELIVDDLSVDGKLYDGFFESPDKVVMRAVRAAEPEQLSEFVSKFSDIRLQTLVPLYKARNFPESLNPAEQQSWDAFIRNKLKAGAKAKFDLELKQVKSSKLPQANKAALEELVKWSELVTGEK